MVRQLTLVIAVVLVLCSCTLAQRYIPVSNSSQFQDAIASALPGDRIHLLNREPLVLLDDFEVTRSGTAESPIIIEGQGLEDSYLTIQDEEGVVLRIMGDYLILRNFSVRGGSHGIFAIANNNVIEFVNFAMSEHYSLYLDSTSSHNIVRNCRFSGFTRAGIRIGDPVARHEGNSLIDNVFIFNASHNFDGIEIRGNEETSGDYVANNRFHTVINPPIHFIYQDGGNDFRYYNNTGDVAIRSGYSMWRGLRSEFRGNNCGRIAMPYLYCIMQYGLTRDTRVYSDNSCDDCFELTNVPVIDIEQ